MAYERLGDKQKALEYYDQSLPRRRAVNDREGLAATFHNIGLVRASLGEQEAALEVFDQALRLWRTIGSPASEARTLAGMAKAERDRGNLTEALGKIGDALKLVESLRNKIDVRDLRASYLGATRSYYEFCVDLLMRLHRLDPSKGHAVAAFQTSERSRARALIETLAESRAEIRNGVDPALLKSERALQKRLESKADNLIRLLSGKGAEEQAADTRKEIEALEIEYQQLQSQIRAASPRYAALTRPQPLSLAEIQRQALDNDTLLLEYALGEERSYLWAVTRTSITSHELEPRKEIEQAASHVRDLLTARNRTVRFETVDERQVRIAEADAEYPKAAAALSQMLLGPVADQLEKKRLLVVGDGALQYVSFAALPLPATGRRGDGATRRSGAVEMEERGGGETGGESLRRSVARSPRRPVAYKPLIVDHEVVSLPSASTLVVLRRELTGRKPAPKTVAALADPVFDPGDERFKTSIVSQGLVGLTRGFMYAGAARVLVSLWEVNDHATSELMGRLYRGILGKRRLTPAAALREAQASLWREQRWRAPYYWAGFTLQGEPR